MRPSSRPRKASSSPTRAIRAVRPRGCTRWRSPRGRRERRSSCTLQPDADDHAPSPSPVRLGEDPARACGRRRRGRSATSVRGEPADAPRTASASARPGGHASRRCARSAGERRAEQHRHQERGARRRRPTSGPSRPRPAVWWSATTTTPRRRPRARLSRRYRFVESTLGEPPHVGERRAAPRAGWPAAAGIDP